MEKCTNSLIRKHRKPGGRIASGQDNQDNHDNSEQIRELEELQRGLAERIGKIQRAANRNQAN